MNGSQIVLDYINRCLLYQKESGKLFWKQQPHIKSRCVIGKEAGSLKPRGYRNIEIMGKVYSMHRIIWLIEHGSWPNNWIDHINGIKNDNRIENLRDVSPRANCSNKYYHRSGKKIGASFNKKRNRWYSEISHNGKRYFLGSFLTEDWAVTAYQNKLKELEAL